MQFITNFSNYCKHLVCGQWSFTADSAQDSTKSECTLDKKHFFLFPLTFHLWPFMFYVMLSSIGEEIAPSSTSVIWLTTKWWARLEGTHIWPVIIMCGFQFSIIKIWAYQGYSNQVLIFSVCSLETAMQHSVQRGNVHVCKHNQCCRNIHRMKSWLHVVDMWSVYGVCIFSPAMAASKCAPLERQTIISFSHRCPFPNTLPAAAHTHTVEAHVAGLVVIAG